MTDILIHVSPKDINDKLYGDMKHFHMNSHNNRPQIKQFNYQKIYNTIYNNI
jgi:hypothetical protein